MSRRSHAVPKWLVRSMRPQNPVERVAYWTFVCRVSKKSFFRKLFVWLLFYLSLEVVYPLKQCANQPASIGTTLVTLVLLLGLFHKTPEKPDDGSGPWEENIRDFQENGNDPELSLGRKTGGKIDERCFPFCLSFANRHKRDKILSKQKRRTFQSTDE